MSEKKTEQAGSTQRSGFFDRVFNLLLACLLIIPALLVVGMFYAVHLMVKKDSRTSFFYSGVRLGRNRKPFAMHKIRTLRIDSGFEEMGEILQPDTRRELPLGKLLRDSRLDELPQLWNVIRGDMNLVGPRPLRPMVYEHLRQELSNCDSRFRVKPGMTGYAQFLTPSHTPKRIRFAIDNYYINQGPRPWRDLFLIIWTIREVFRKAIQNLSRRVITRWKIFRNRGHGVEQRQMTRYRSKHIWIQLTNVDFSDHKQPAIKIYDINPRAVSFISTRELQRKEMLYFYLVGCKECETGVKKKARCGGYVYKTHSARNGTRYVVFYEPLSPRHRYLVDHYVLRQTVA